jgi:hypothetical protein
VQQHGLRLIVQGVADRNGIGALLRSYSAQRPIPCIAGCCLWGAATDLNGHYRTWEAQSVGGALNESSIVMGSRAQTVIDVRYMQSEVFGFLE